MIVALTLSFCCSRSADSVMSCMPVPFKYAKRTDNSGDLFPGKFTRLAKCEGSALDQPYKYYWMIER